MLLRRIIYWSNFTVLRWQLILALLSFWLIWLYLDHNYKADDSTLWVVMHGAFFYVLGWTIFWLFVGAILSALIAWGYFFFLLRGGDISYRLKFGEDQRTEAGFVPVRITIGGVIFRPLFGSIRSRLVFSQYRLSEPVLLDEGVYKNGSLIREGVTGKGTISLHDRGIYDVREIDLFFCDMFRLIALPITIRANEQLFTLPVEQERKEIQVSPNTTEEQTHRIEIPKRVQGEYLNYKDFETGDDVRRIVWKIYARSGQLVVRIPETMDPYASHLYFYASFFNTLGDATSGGFEQQLLNGYKDKLRNIFETLQKSEYEVRMPTDQETPKLQGESDKHSELLHLAAASWQKDRPLTEYVNARKAAFVCLSTLVPVNEVAQLLNNLAPDVPVVAIRMSDAIRSPFRMKLKNIFIVPEETPADKLSNAWLLSPLRSRLKDNEREMLNLFTKRGNAFLVSTDEG